MRRSGGMVVLLFFVSVLLEQVWVKAETNVVMEEFGEVEISFRFRLQEYARGSNQYAVWIQDNNGNVIRTLFVTRFTAVGGYRNQLDCLPLWVNRADAPHLPEEEIDGFSGATPRDGNQVYTWNGTDRYGNKVPLGKYVYYVEGTTHWDSRIVFSGLINAGRSQRKIKSQYEVYSDDHDIVGSDMITDVVVTYYPTE